MTSVLGLDGCRGGWAGALLEAERVRWRRYDGWGEGLRTALAEPVAAVAADVPIGLPALGAVRACDLAARRALGPRRASVFLAPAREVLAGAGTHAEISARSVRLTGKGVSVQAYGIFGRIAAVDAVVSPADQGRLVEAHPELAFALLADSPGSKHTPAGLAVRAAALAAVLPPFDLAARPRGVSAADALDALACAWIARRWLGGVATLLPSDPPRDARGLFMGITA